MAGNTVNGLKEKVQNETQGIISREKETVASILSKDTFKTRLNEILGKRSTAFMSSVISISNTPALKNCAPMSIVSAAMIAATLDLPIDKNLGFAHIVPYKSKIKDTNPPQYEELAQFQIGSKGFIQLAERSGQYQRINVKKIYEGEIVSYNELTEDIILDKNNITDKTKIVGYVGYFRLNNGFEKIYYMTTEEIHAHAEKYSKTYSNKYGLWQTDFDAMAQKTVLKLMLSKYGILSIDMQNAIQTDQAAAKTLYDGKNNDLIYVDNDEPNNDTEDVSQSNKDFQADIIIDDDGVVAELLK